MKKQIILVMLAFWMLLGLTNLEARVKRVYVRKAPPTKKVVVVKKPAKPHKKAVWVSGRWQLNGKKYVWKKGHWLKPRKGFVWVAGHWKSTPRGWVWIDGHWKRIK